MHVPVWWASNLVHRREIRMSDGGTAKNHGYSHAGRVHRETVTFKEVNGEGSADISVNVGDRFLFFQIRRRSG